MSMSTARLRLARERSATLLLTGALALATVASSAFSFALFTDQETVTGTFTSGTIVLDDAKVDALTLSTTGMMPGDSVTDDVVIENDGTSQLRYALSTSSTNADTKDVRSQLTLTIKTIDVTTPASPCDNFDGTSVLASTVLFDGTTNAGFGSSATGAQTGDRVLAAAANETLCFRVSLPSATSNAYQGATTTTTFTFDAEQTVNN